MGSSSLTRPVRLILRSAAFLIASGAAFAVPVAGQRPPLAMLDQLQDGRWELRLHDASGPVEQVCLGDGRRLIQLRHRVANCHRLIIEDGATEVTVQYTCTGKGYGRTSIRRETGSLVQIQTQGIADGLPFDFSIEGRRVGECSA